MGQPEDKRKWADYSTVGIMFPASIAVGLAIGYFLDELLHTSPYLLIIFTLYGMGAGFYNLFKVTRKHDRAKKTDDK
jgi:ATP synthase protein I